MYLSVPFFIITRNTTVIGVMVVLRSHILLIYISLFFFICLFYSLTDMLLSVATDILIKRHFFSFFHDYICSIVLYFSLSSDCKVSDNCSFFDFCYWLWLAFIPFFIIQYFKAFTYLSNKYNVQFYHAFLYRVYRC